MIDDVEGPSTKEPDVEVEALDIEGEEPIPEVESTPINPRMETRSMSRTSSPLLLRKSILPSLEVMKSPHQRSHLQELLRTIRKATS